MEHKVELGVCATIGTILGLYLLAKMMKTRKKRWIHVGRIKALYIYPVKSFQSISVTSAEVTPLGLKSGEYKDRHFVVADKSGEKFFTAREFPKFVLIKPIINDGVLTLTSENHEKSIGVNLKDAVENGTKTHVKLWNNSLVPAVDCGDEIANWICDYISQPRDFCRLYYFDDTVLNSRRIIEDPQYRAIGGKRVDQIVFDDVAPVNLQTEASLEDLNSKLTEKKVSILNFRPSVYVTGNGPFDEDNWAEIKIGENNVKLTRAAPCTRCIFTTIDPETGEKDPKSEPLRTLRKYRQVDASLKPIFQYSPVFGANLLVDQTGVVHVGDKVYAVYK